MTRIPIWQKLMVSDIWLEWWKVWGETPKPKRWCVVIKFGEDRDLAVKGLDHITSATGYTATVEEL
jgi:hypothetical protein